MRSRSISVTSRQLVSRCSSWINNLGYHVSGTSSSKCCWKLRHWSVIDGTVRSEEIQARATPRTGFSLSQCGLPGLTDFGSWSSLIHIFSVISSLSVLFYKVGWTVIMFVWIKAFPCATVTDKGHGNHGSARKRPEPFSLEVKTSSGHDSTVTHILIHNGILRFIYYIKRFARPRWRAQEAIHLRNLHKQPHV